MEYQDLIYEKRGRIAYVTINRPEVLNAISPLTQRELVSAFLDFDEDPDVWVAVLTGAGDRAFCAGWDIKWQDAHPEEFHRYTEERKRKMRGVYWHMEAIVGGDLPREVWKPIIGAVKGYCLGGGMELALHCDLIVAAESASFGLPEVTRGWPPVAANFMLPRQIPLKIATEMLLLGDRISAQRAYEVGLVNKVVPADEVMPTATRYAERMCENAPLALQTVKELVMRGLDMPLNYAPLAWHLRSESVTRVVDESEDKVEGRRAFTEKRKPNFKGR